MEIRRIENGEIISQPGFYAMDIGWYHSSCCDGPSVSSSGLRALEIKTPLHFWDESYLNPDRNPEATDELEAAHFRLGRAGHFLMLEPHLFEQNIAVRPDAWDSWRSAASKAWAAQQQQAGKTILTPDELARARGVAAQLNAHPLLKEGLLGGLVEVSMICRDAKTGIWIKSRPDSIPRDNAFSDLKIMNEASPQAVARAIDSLGYDLQLALAGVCMFKLTERTIDQFWLVCCESSRPHAIHVAALSVNAVYWARIRLRHALDTMAECLKTGQWPSYESDGAEYDITDRKATLWKEFQNGGLLPKDDTF